MLETLHERATNCVNGMGDVFWDRIPQRDTPLQFRNPHTIAVECVEKALRGLYEEIATIDEVYLLQEEYEVLVEELPSRSDDDLTRALVQSAEWTKGGAQSLIGLARTYGAFMLRHALALAKTLDIEDGELGY